VHFALIKCARENFLNLLVIAQMAARATDIKESGMSENKKALLRTGLSALIQCFDGPQLEAMARVAEGISKPGTFHVRVAQCDPEKDAEFTKNLLKTVDIAAYYPKAKVDQLKNVLSGLSETLSLLTPRHKFFVIFGEMRDWFKHMGIDIEIALKMLECYDPSPAAAASVATAAGIAPAATDSPADGTAPAATDAPVSSGRKTKKTNGAPSKRAKKKSKN
jgi:hypothetical protein